MNEVHLGWSCESLSYSSFGKYDAAAAGIDVVVVDADTLAKKLRFRGHNVNVLSVRFMLQSSKIVSGSRDGS